MIQGSTRKPAERLYDAFRPGDGGAMQSCYADDATFRDRCSSCTARTA